MLPDPIQTFRDRERSESRWRANVRLATLAFLGAGIVAIATLVMLMWREL
jgi:hypothetical protein